MFWNSQQNPMIFSVKVFRLNVLQTFSRVIVGVTRRYNGGNQVIWYWPEQILCVDTESIKAKLHKHNTGTMFLMQKMGLQQQQQLSKVTEIMTMPNLVELVNSLWISYLFPTFNSRLHIDHSLDYPSKLTTCSIYLHLLLKDIASRLVFAVIAVNLTYLIIVIIAYWKRVSECLFLALIRLRTKYRFFCVKIDLKYQRGPLTNLFIPSFQFLSIHIC